MLFFQYLKDLYHYSRRIFYGVLLAISITITVLIFQITDFLYIEASPFVVWGMYSEKAFPQKNYNVYLITVNDTQIVNYTKGHTALNNYVLINALEYYKKMRSNNDIDQRRQFFESRFKLDKKWQHELNSYTNSKEQYSSFGEWYKRYLGQTLNMKIEKSNVRILNANYSDDKHLIIKDTSELIQF